MAGKAKTQWSESFPIEGNSREILSATDCVTLGGSCKSPEALPLVRCRPGFSPAGHTAVRLWPVFQRGSFWWVLNIKTVREWHREQRESWLWVTKRVLAANLFSNILHFSVWFRRSCNSRGIDTGEKAAHGLWGLRKWEDGGGGCWHSVSCRLPGPGARGYYTSLPRGGGGEGQHFAHPL